MILWMQEFGKLNFLGVAMRYFLLTLSKADYRSATKMKMSSYLNLAISRVSRRLLVASIPLLFGQ